MAGALSLQKIMRPAAAALAFVALGMTTSAHAEALPDPTRPPPGFSDATPGTGGMAPAAGASATQAAGGRESKARGPELQSVQLPRKGRPVAIISGQYVPLGEKFGRYELISVSEQRVILLAGKTQLVLRLTPSAEKRPAGSSRPQTAVKVRADGKVKKQGKESEKAK